MNQLQKDAIQKLRTDGFSYYQIASSLGISENTVKSYCRRNNLGGKAIAGKVDVRDDYCLQCGTTLKQNPGKKIKKFCSDNCRMAWWKDHPEVMRHRSIRQFTCKTCGQSFEGFGKRERKFCSRACYGKSKAVRHEKG